MRRILVCPPTHYNINYEINPWMKVANKANQTQANRQWDKLVETLSKLNVKVEIMSPAPDLPDLVFTANAAVIHEDTAILSNFHHPERQNEKPLFKKWFEDNGFKTVEITESFEGAGDALAGSGHKSGDKLFCGYGFRSTWKSHHEVSKLVKHKMASLALADPYFYHLDTCFCPLGNDNLLVYPKAFTPNTYTYIQSTFNCIEVPEDDAHRFACNAVPLDQDVILSAGCDKTREKLERAGYTVHECETSEFIKAGGSCRCLCLLL